jgi:hypothetical protein
MFNCLLAMPGGLQHFLDRRLLYKGAVSLVVLATKTHTHTHTHTHTAWHASAFVAYWVWCVICVTEAANDALPAVLLLPRD